MVAIVGVPGSGKSSTAKAVCARLKARGVPAANVPMDGFHYYRWAFGVRRELFALLPALLGGEQREQTRVDGEALSTLAGGQLSGWNGQSSSATIVSPHRRQLDQMPDPELAHARRGAEWTFDARAYHACLAQIKATGGGRQRGGGRQVEELRGVLSLTAVVSPKRRSAASQPGAIPPVHRWLAAHQPAIAAHAALQARRRRLHSIMVWATRCLGTSEWGGTTGWCCRRATTCCWWVPCVQRLLPRAAAPPNGRYAAQWMLHAVTTLCTGRHSKACCALPTP